MPCSATFLSWGCTPHRTDTINTLLKRIAGSTDGGGGGGGGFTVGVVDPNGVVTGSPGDGYVNTANKTLWIKESGVATDTGWLQYV